MSHHGPADDSAARGGAPSPEADTSPHPPIAQGSASDERQREREGGILDLVAVVVSQRKAVAVVTVATVVAAMAVALLLPPSYVARTVLVPFAGAQPRSQFAFSQLPAGVASLVGAGSSAGERLIGVVLESRTLRDSLVKQMLTNRRTERQVRAVLKDGLRTQRNQDGSMLIQVRAKDPRLAADMANALPTLVNEVLARVNAEAAQRKQAFLRAQVDTAQEALTESEERLLEFQQRRSTPALEDQSRRTVDAAAALQQDIYQREVAVAQLRRTSTPDNPELRSAVAELEARRNQLRRLTQGGGGSPVFLSMDAGPELRAASVRLLRDYSQDERIYQSLTTALAESQIDANNNLPVLTVLDSAEVPRSPTRSLPLTLALAVPLGLLLGVIVGFVRDATGRMRRNPANATFFAVWDDFMQDLRRLSPFRGRRGPRVTNRV